MKPKTLLKLRLFYRANRIPVDLTSIFILSVIIAVTIVYGIAVLINSAL